MKDTVGNFLFDSGTVLCQYFVMLTEGLMTCISIQTLIRETWPKWKKLKNVTMSLIFGLCQTVPTLPLKMGIELGFTLVLKVCVKYVL
jgi:hypothetical protein